MRAGQQSDATQNKRHGLPACLRALDIATGSVLGKCYRRPSPPWSFLLPEDDRQRRSVDLDIHLVLDNYGTHKPPFGSATGYRRGPPTYALSPQPMLHGLPGRALVRSTHPAADQARLTPSVQELEAGDPRVIATHNQQPKPFRWTKSADLTCSIARFATGYSRRLTLQHLIQEINDQETAKSEQSGTKSGTTPIGEFY